MFQQPSDALSDVSARAKRREALSGGRQTRRVEIAIPISGDPSTFRGRTAPPAPINAIPAIVTTAITPASGTAAGTGNAQLYYLSTPDTTTLTADPDNTAVVILNWYQNSGTITVGAHIWITVWSNAYWLLGADC